MRQLEVWVQLPGGAEVHAGDVEELQQRHGARKGIRFQYRIEYVRATGAYKGAYNLSPELSLDSYPQETPVHRQMFMAFEDAGPDRWGQNLIQAKADARARTDGERIRRADALGILTLVSDNTRQGGLRFKAAGVWHGPPASLEEGAVMDWQSLTSAADAIMRGNPLSSDLRRLLDQGSFSAGGARPKTNALKDGRLVLAKMPHVDDRWDVSLWEAATLDMQRSAGIDVPGFSLHRFGEDKSILFLERFDRNGDTRIGYLSGRTIMGLEDHDPDRGSYEELASALRASGGEQRDLEQLFRRVALTILVNNTDDHMRNFGVLRTRNAWRISPSFDVNPQKSASSDSTPIVRGGDRDRRTLEELLENRDMYDLTEKQAIAAITEVERATANWSEIGQIYGEDPENLEHFSTMFEGPERDWARNLSSGKTRAVIDISSRTNPHLRRGDLGLGTTAGGGNRGSFAKHKRRDSEPPSN